jgi:8-oxo-dGTP diphosphatase
MLCRNKEPNKGKFVPVGGKIDPFESPHNCIIREIKEETGILLNKVTYCGTLVETSPTIYNWISFIYIGDIDDIIPPKCNEGTLTWIENEDLTKIPTPPTDLILFEYIKSNKKFAFNAIYDENLNLIQMVNDLECNG